MALAVLCGATQIAACAPARRAGSAAQETRPRIKQLEPDSVRLIRGNVTEFDIRGSGFDTSRTSPGNTVRIGEVVLTSVPSSANGTLIRVAVPDAVPSRGEAPPSPWMGGRYPVSVQTRAGTSDTLFLVIASAGGNP
jgi:hypothetical protein